MPWARCGGSGRKRSIRRRIAANERSRHRHLGELEDHVAAVPHDPGADLHQLLAQASSATTAQPPAATPASAGSWRGCRQGRDSWSRTALWRKAWQDSRVQRSASLPSLIHCSAVPRPL